MDMKRTAIAAKIIPNPGIINVILKRTEPATPHNSTVVPPRNKIEYFFRF